ncbi:MAG: YqgE/AlgH family protein [Desulfobacterales bacterium]
MNPNRSANRRIVKRSIIFALLIIMMLPATVHVRPVLGAESTTTRKAGGLDFTANGGKRQGREVPQSLRAEPGAEHPVWKAQSSGLGRTTPLLKVAVPKKDPGGFDSKEELAKGKFLVASRRLRDPNFKETVVLLIDYGQDGAMGLVINRPSEVKLATVFPDIKALKERKDTIYVGGPVAVNQILLLVGTSQMPEESQEVITDVYISSSWKVLERLMKNAAKDERFRIFAGYAGWAPHQLDFERSRGDWHVLKADAETVFDKEPSELWQELILRTSVKWVRVQVPFRIKRR